MNEKEEAFLVEYLELCTKHKTTVGACGCCNSPWIIGPDGSETEESWNKEIKEHEEHLRKES